MILALLTSYNDVSSILVPIVGLLLPGVIMSLAFLSIETKNN